MSESEHNNSDNLYADEDSQQRDLGGFYQNFESQASYMRDVSKISMLSSNEVLAWAQKISESRERIRLIIGEFPQVILQQLCELRDSSETGRLPGGMIINDGDELTVQSGRELLEELIKWASQHQENFLKWQSKTPALDIFRNEFDRRLKSIGLRDRFFEACVEKVLRPENSAPAPELAKLDEEVKALSDADKECRQAKNVLVEANLRLVFSVAKHYATGLLPFQDLIQEGNIGLMRAVETYNYKLGHRFSTYATYWIRQSIGRAVALQGRSIRMPINTLRQLSKIRQCERELLLQNGRVPEAHEIAAKLELSTAKVNALIKMAQQPISLHSIRADNQELGDTISDEKSPHPREQIDFESLKDTVRDALNTLEDKEKEVIIRRFGLEDHACETLEQIGKRLNLTSERIRQIEAGALRKLRDPVKNKYFAGFE